MRKFLFVIVIFVTACNKTPLPEYNWSLPPLEVSAQSLPDFSAITDVKQKKQAFTDFLLPMVNRINHHIEAERNLIIVAQSMLKDEEPLGEAALNFLSRIAQRYQVSIEQQPTVKQLDALLRRVDVLPPGLVLAQAANESAWGTSRFATKANNLFGQWCFVQGCGLVPLARSNGLTHEVRKFKSPEASLQSYMLNINTHRAYQELRALRTQGRKENRIDALTLAEGLTHYSERGQLYVKELQQMIRGNSALWPQILEPHSS